MHQVEIIVGGGREAEHFDTAVYRFIELKGAQVEFSMIVRSEPIAFGERKVVELWDHASASEFQRFWNAFRLDRPQSLPPQPFGLDLRADRDRQRA